MKKQIINWYNLPARIHSLFLAKQDKLTAGSNIKIEDNVISVTGGGGGGSDLMVSITHADLLALVNSSSLTKGQQYRITDYVATVDTDVYNPDNVGFFARSNNHAFDIIVVADSENKLNENARAIRHNGDTYFPSNTKFESWQLKYTIFNDSDRFNWALSIGKGVVYKLIDEFDNDVAYDFKSIQFQRDDVWVYTFGGVTDGSLENLNCFRNIISPSSSGLSNNVLGYYCFSNALNLGSRSNTIGESCGLLKLNFAYRNTFRDNCFDITLQRDCYENTFGLNAYSHYFNSDCSQMVIEDDYVSPFYLSVGLSNINLTNQISNFTTQPNGNTVEVHRTVNGVAFRQEVSAGVFETFDVV